MAVGLVAAVFLSACEVPTTGSVEGQDVPVFRLAGTGAAGEFAVQDDTGVAWSIRPLNGGFVEISKMSPITYGTIPSGWTQKFPKDGAKPPALREGVRYGAGAATVNAMGGGCYFLVKDGRAVELNSHE
ncbi:MAG TPA: hypothetical protein VI756_06175 [Blastocatellia bacterium]